ncbi:MAG: hypothetical protein ACJAQZ_002524 [Planctomycetota bacterium]
MFAAGCMELQPANTIRSAAALGMAILFMVKTSNGNGKRETLRRTCMAQRSAEPKG